MGKIASLFVVCMALLFFQTSFGQALPQGSDVNLYFPQVADGGEWQTVFIFNNPDPSATATVDLYFLDNDGYALPINLGTGASFHHTLTIPPRGSRTIKSTGSSTNIVVGWAFVASSIPIQAISAFRETSGGVPILEITVRPTLPTIAFMTPASRLLGIAIANPYNHPITVNLAVYDSEGKSLASPVPVTISALGHQSFYVFEKFPNIPDFSGMLTIGAADSNYPVNDQFIALTISQDANGFWSGLPSGTIKSPISHSDRIQLVFSTVVNSMIKLGYLTNAPSLFIDSSQTINAHAQSGTKLTVTLGMSQLISDSESELAHVIGHELGHIYQQRNNGRLLFNQSNKELDADVWGVILALASGYDPYAAAGVLGKFEMATNPSSILMQIFEDILDPHTSITNRITNLHDTLVRACSGSNKTICDQYKKTYHPNFPSTAPLQTRDHEGANLQ